MKWCGLCTGMQGIFWKASEENGGPLSEKNLFGGPYCKIKFCNFLIMDLAVFEDVWLMKRYLLNIVCYEEILLVVVCEEISC